LLQNEEVAMVSLDNYPLVVVVVNCGYDF